MPDTRKPRDRKDRDLTTAKSIVELVNGMQFGKVKMKSIERIEDAGRDDGKAAGA